MHAYVYYYYYRNVNNKAVVKYCEIWEIENLIIGGHVNDDPLPGHHCFEHLQTGMWIPASG